MVNFNAFLNAPPEQNIREGYKERETYTYVIPNGFQCVKSYPIFVLSKRFAIKVRILKASKPGSISNVDMFEDTFFSSYTL